MRGLESDIWALDSQGASAYVTFALIEVIRQWRAWHVTD